MKETCPLRTPVWHWVSRLAEKDDAAGGLAEHRPACSAVRTEPMLMRPTLKGRQRHPILVLCVNEINLMFETASNWLKEWLMKLPLTREPEYRPAVSCRGS